MTDLRNHDATTADLSDNDSPSSVDPTDGTAEHRSVLRRILDWLTAGYPSGVPPTERYALIALLKRSLSDDDIRQIIAGLTTKNSSALVDGVITEDEIRAMTERVLEQPPSEEDINKVSARLATAGWPLEGISAAGSGSEKAQSED